MESGLQGKRDEVVVRKLLQSDRNLDDGEWNRGGAVGRLIKRGKKGIAGQRNSLFL